MALADQIIGVESGGRAIGNARSSAFGPGQFIKSTWLDVLRRNRPDIAQGKSDDELLALRANPILSRQMTDAYARENGQRLTDAGFEATPGNTYLAHFAGPAGAVNLLRADPAAPVGPILGEQAMKANPFLANMTAGQLRSWADKKMGVPLPPAAITLPAAQPEASPQAAAAPAAAGPMLDQVPAAMAMAPSQPAEGLNRPMFRPSREALAAAALGPQALGPQPGGTDQAAADPLSLWWARQNTMTG